MSDFNSLCDVFDNIGLKYNIKELENSRIITVVSNQEKVDCVSINTLFTFDGNGNFEIFYAKKNK